MTKMNRRDFLKAAAVFGAALTGMPQQLAAAATPKKNSLGAVIKGERVLGRGAAAMKVTPLGFGCMGMSFNRSERPSEEKCIKLIRDAVERGVTFFDTAIRYGPLTNERLVGKALDPYKGQVAIATKFGHEIINGKATGRQDSRPETVRRYCEESLKRLRVDCIDLFYQHRFDRNVPIEEVAGTIGDLIKEGKVKHWGVCEVSSDTIRRAHAVQPLTAVQSEYHLMFRDVETNGVLETCRELGIGFVPYSPLNRGFLGGDINEYTRFDPNNDNRQTLPRFAPAALRENVRIVSALQYFGRTRGMTAAQLALAWLLSKGDFIVPIPGTTKLAHLEENPRTMDFELTAQEIAELEAAVEAIPVVGDRYPAEQARLVGH